MPISKKKEDLTPRGQYPDLQSYVGPPSSYGGSPSYSQSLTDWDKEMGWGLLDIMDAIEDWQEDDITDDNLSRLIAKIRNAPMTDPYRGQSEPPPLGFMMATQAAQTAEKALFEFKDDDSYENQSEAILTVDLFTAQLAALGAAGLLDPNFYRKGYKRNKLKKNPTETDNSELLNALFKLILAYRVTYTGILTDFRTYTPRNIQTYFINVAQSALSDAARTSKGSFLLSDDDFPQSVITYLSNVTAQPDRVSHVEKNIFNAKVTLSEIIGGGFESIFWRDDLWEEVTVSFTDD